MKNTDDTLDILIIGAGVIGNALAAEFSKFKLNTAVLEKASDAAEGISKANSGVLHAGFNVKTGSLKAKLNIKGFSAFPGLCSRLDVEYKKCGKLVIADSGQELLYLEKLLQQGIKNGCSGLSIINEGRIKELEPYASGKFALYSPNTAVVSSYGFAIALAELAALNGTSYSFNSEVIRLLYNEELKFFEIITPEKRYYSKTVINAAGLSADSIAALPYGEAAFRPYTVYPVKGEYHILDCESSSVLKTAVYPVPPADGSGLGIHLTPTVFGNIMLGPSAENTVFKDDLSTTASVMQQLKNEAYRLLPALEGIPVIKSFAGIRPKLFRPGGLSSFEDFVIEENPDFPGFLNLLGIESPGLTSAPAIAEYVRDIFAEKHFVLKIKKHFIKEREKTVRLRKLDESETAALCTPGSAYSDIVCRCSRVSRQELLDALNNPLHIKSLSGLKKRSHAMAGRCQGYGCIPEILKIIGDGGSSAPL